MPAPKSPPSWEAPFLELLARTGNVRVAAEACGVDPSTAYNRRSRYPDFKAAWLKVLEERAACVADPSSCERPSTSPFDNAQDRLGTNVEVASLPDNLIARSSATGLKLSRAGHHRWSEASEKRFLEELAASANIRRSAAAVGFSYEAVNKQRLKKPAFAAAWDAAIAVGRARLEAYLVAAAERRFDPDALPMTDADPKVTVAEAVAILKHGATGRRPSTSLGTNEASDAEVAEVEAARARILMRLERMRDRMIDEGWVEIEDGTLIPPGYGKLGV